MRQKISPREACQIAKRVYAATRVEEKKLINTQEDSDWMPASKAKEYVIYLTYHIDDLYPVCGFVVEGSWYRITEGAEDEIIPGTGNYRMLLHEPTHILDLENLNLPIGSDK